MRKKTQKRFLFIFSSALTPFVARIISAIFFSADWVADYFSFANASVILIGAVIGSGIVVGYDIVFTRFAIRAEWAYRNNFLISVYILFYGLGNAFFPPDPFILIAWITLPIYSAGLSITASIILTVTLKIYKSLRKLVTIQNPLP